MHDDYVNDKSPTKGFDMHNNLQAYLATTLYSKNGINIL